MTFPNQSCDRSIIKRYSRRYGLLHYDKATWASTKIHAWKRITSLKLCREIVGDTSFEKMWLECSTLLRWRYYLEHMCSMALAQNHISWRRIKFSCMMAKVRKPECVCVCVSSPLCRDIWGQQLCWINCSAFKLQASSACPCQLEIVVIDSHFH